MFDTMVTCHALLWRLLINGSKIWIIGSMLGLEIGEGGEDWGSGTIMQLASIVIKTLPLDLLKS